MSEANSYTEIYQMVQKIPRGQVATYGQIATICGMPQAARLVGLALHVCDIQKIPWHRVINRRGTISTTCLEHPVAMQKELLEREGIQVKKKAGAWTIDLRKYQWQD
ncbi:MAG: methylated-DNA--[protein]-cysteine S-methyltransferase [Candidatus Buchananbacteria bacterium]